MRIALLTGAICIANAISGEAIITIQDTTLTILLVALSLMDLAELISACVYRDS